MRELVAHVRALKSVPESTTIDYVLHAGSRGDQGFVTIFYYAAGQPLVIAKLPRLHNELIEAEIELLQRVYDLLEGSSIQHTIDHVVDRAEVGGRVVMFKDFFKGRTAAQCFATKRPALVTAVLASSAEWMLQYMRATAQHRRHTEADKRAAARTILRPDSDDTWVDAFCASPAGYLAPSHGDLVPANILIEDTRVAAVIDFENFAMDGFPLADFVGLIVSAGTLVFGRGESMLEQTFLQPTWFSREVARHVASFCRDHDCTVEDFVALLPLYSDRALTIAESWDLPAETTFHRMLRDGLRANRERLLSTLRQP